MPAIDNGQETDLIATESHIVVMMVSCSGFEFNPC